MSITINKLEIENVKRVKAVTLEPSMNGLTIIGGKNGQGKTSVLDSICWALGGDKYRPSEPRRDGSVIPPSLHIELSNGLIVERKGKNSDLKVIDPSGNKAGQKLLDAFVSQFALDLPKFINANAKEKAQILLRIIGVGDQLAELEKQEIEKYNQRHAIGQIADQKKKYAEELTSYPDAPDELISISELIQKQQEILAKNGENQRKRQNIEKYQKECDELFRKKQEIESLFVKCKFDLEIAQKDAEDLEDESTAELEQNIADIETINEKVRSNLSKETALEEASKYSQQYADLSAKIEDIRKSKIDLLDNANLPLPGLSVENSELVYGGYKWDNMSGSDQLKVSVAIVRKLNPECGFVLMDKLEAMDVDTLNEFGEWLEAEGLQVIATRVSTSDECSIIIEDGYGGTPSPSESPKTNQTNKNWKAGSF
jgi:predicted ATP-dependent endonuclease of OLD family